MKSRRKVSKRKLVKSKVIPIHQDTLLMPVYLYNEVLIFLSEARGYENIRSRADQILHRLTVYFGNLNG